MVCNTTIIEVFSLFLFLQLHDQRFVQLIHFVGMTGIVAKTLEELVTGYAMFLKDLFIILRHHDFYRIGGLEFLGFQYCFSNMNIDKHRYHFIIQQYICRNFFLLLLAGEDDHGNK